MMTRATRIGFNHDWLFCLDDDTAFASPGLEDTLWRRLTLPHDWSAEACIDEANPAGSGGGYARTGIGWYRRHFAFTPEMVGKVVRVTFDGIYMDADVYLNGQRFGGCGYGYSSFFVDLASGLRSGDNLLAVRVNNSLQPNSRWYTGSGIYRNVWLEVLEPVHLRQWGIFAMTSQLYADGETPLAKLLINTEVDNDSHTRGHAEVHHTLLDAQGQVVCTAGTAVQLDANASGAVMATPLVKSPRLWTAETPYLYTLRTEVSVENRTVDTAELRIGIRTATFDCDRGFLLNAQPVKIKGMCVHHDCGVTGAVGFRETWERRLKLMKDMGCNGIRCAHNPPAPELLELCDELGLLVMDEIFDEWMLTKDKIHNYYSQALAYGSSQFFSRDAEKDLMTMLHRDRSHPSVILWSIGNEIPEQATVEGEKLLHFLQDICHREDPSRMVISACDNIVAAAPATALRAFENALDVVGYNYVARWRNRAETLYDEDRSLYPGRRMLGSENPSAGGARGDYTLLNAKNTIFRKDYLHVTLDHEFLWRYTMSRDFVAGDYLWTGIDYLGESEWPSKGAASGPIDTAGFPKDTFYYFRSLWNTGATTLHLLPHWNWPGEEGRFKQVVCYTNCEEVKLYLNGRFVGTKGYDCPNVGAQKSWDDRAKWTNPTTHDLHLAWDVPYEPGELKAEGYLGGKLIATETVRTTGKAAQLRACADCAALAVDGVAHITLSVLDSVGQLVPDACFPVRCTVAGAGKLIGMDNGDMLDLTPWPSQERRVSNGLLMAMVRAEGPGSVTATFVSEGMEAAVVTLCVQDDSCR
ncbi:MAG: DUF4982 domain-containing protein, partial [Eubacteriales bacterium]|nr:DUF4982 domain-containing protein [Eubacteriales bacterium]